jgi:UDP-N-acetyl-D-glucosamine dehydrogenase
MLQFTDANPVRPTSSSEDFDLANLEALGLDAVDPKPADVAVLGLGYVGLPTALGLATAGSSVIGIDASTARLTAIQDARVDLLPSDLERLRAALGRAEFQLTSNPSALRNAHAVLICVPTPVDPHLTPDLRPLARACATVVEQAVRGQTIILTSTTYVGTTRDLLLGPLTARGLAVGEDVFVAFSPERIDPGNAAHPQQSVPRVVGGATRACSSRAAHLLGRVAEVVHEVSSPEVAEMTKLYENTFRAVNIALANELAHASRALDLEVMEVIGAAATKPYGFMPFYPGPGVGGHCIPCDPHYLLWQLRAKRLTSPLIERAMASIAERPAQVVNRIREVLSDAGRGLRGTRVLVVGVAYKPGVEDLRESPALEILDALRGQGTVVAYHDALVPSIRLGDGAVLESLADPGGQEWDLVVLHTLHPGVDHGWVGGYANVLDATYRLDEIPHRAVL